MNKISERTGYLEVEIIDDVGDPHTIPSLVAHFLNKDEEVEFAAYKPPHPLRGNPHLIIRAKDPRKALKKAIENAIKALREVERELID